MSVGEVDEVTLFYGESDSEDESDMLTLEELSSAPGTSTAGPSFEPTVMTSSAPEGTSKGKKRRRAISPRAPQEVETRRARLDNESFLDTIAALSPQNQQMVYRAAELGLIKDARPRAFNNRHAVSHEFPVPEEVNYIQSLRMRIIIINNR